MEAVLDLQPVLDLTEAQFFQLCQHNRDLRIERNARGEIIIMPPTGGSTGNRNAEITAQLHTWAKQNTQGLAFDSSTGFRLPNNAIRSPDAAWVSHARFDLLTDEQKERFLPLCPDFLIELKSPTDSMPMIREKMREYIETGAQLTYLIDPEQKRVSIYRPHLPVEVLENPDTLSGDPVLPGFVLHLGEIW